MYSYVNSVMNQLGLIKTKAKHSSEIFYTVDEVCVVVFIFLTLERPKGGEQRQTDPP